VPPLRQRIAECPGELDDLVRHLVTRMTGDGATELVALVREVLDASVGPHYGWPGNVRELEQAVRRILLTRCYDGDARGVASDLRGELIAGLDRGTLHADALLSGYCTLLHQRHRTIEEVARRTKLDRRTVKKYLGLRRNR
jgi:transcriptional regulator with PAS, ATPase and Fis domain